MMNRREMLPLLTAPLMAAANRKTKVDIVGDSFKINGKDTYRGRKYQGKKIEGLLMNTRMVQGIFDDRNAETRGRWAYPDTGNWDAERNTREFIAAMPVWRKHGVLSFTINLQGGSPEGYSKAQPWDTGAIRPDGSLREDYMLRLRKILDRADELGMVPIVGLYYFGQDQRVTDEAAIKRSVEASVRWILTQGYGNILLEICNECNIAAYDHPILKADRVHELITMAKDIQVGGRQLLVGVSYGGNKVPMSNVVKVSNFLLIHGNGVKDPARIAAMVRETRLVKGYRPMPILFNEDDHFDFDKPMNNMMAAIGEYASWGYFEPGASNYRDGYQCPPVNWGMNSPLKQGFFKLCKQVTHA